MALSKFAACTHLIGHMQGHFTKLSARDDALSRSLNSDYLAQLYISPDTKNMDADLVDSVDLDQDLPEEARTVMVFRRGCVLTSACSAQHAHILCCKSAGMSPYGCLHVQI